MNHEPEFEEDNQRCRYCGILWRPAMDTDGSKCPGQALWAENDPDFMMHQPPQGEDT